MNMACCYWNGMHEPNHFPSNLTFIFTTYVSIISHSNFLFIIHTCKYDMIMAPTFKIIVIIVIIDNYNL